MAMTEAQKRANRKYDKKTYAHLAVTVRKDKAARFRELCHENGLSVNGVFSEAIDRVLLEYGGEGDMALIGKKEHKAGEYDEGLFTGLYDAVERGEMKAAEAAERLGVHVRKWYRLAKEERERRGDCATE